MIPLAARRFFNVCVSQNARFGNSIQRAPPAPNQAPIVTKALRCPNRPPHNGHRHLATKRPGDHIGNAASDTLGCGAAPKIWNANLAKMKHPMPTAPRKMTCPKLPMGCNNLDNRTRRASNGRTASARKPPKPRCQKTAVAPCQCAHVTCSMVMNE